MAYAVFYGRDAAMAEKRKKKEEEKVRKLLPFQP